jgi:hypothetical protein
MRRVDEYPNTSNGYPHTEEFLRYAAASGGMPVTLIGKYESIVPGSSLTLETIKPPDVHYRKKLPPFVVGLRVVKARRSAVHQNGDKLFEGTVTQSLNRQIKRGDNIIGLASPESPVLIVNTSDPKEMDHIMETYDDPQCREHINL